MFRRPLTNAPKVMEAQCKQTDKGTQIPCARVRKYPTSVNTSPPPLKNLKGTHWWSHRGDSIKELEPPQKGPTFGRTLAMPWWFWMWISKLWPCFDWNSKWWWCFVTITNEIANQGLALSEIANYAHAFLACDGANPPAHMFLLQN